MEENNDLYKEIEQHLREKEMAKAREKADAEEEAYRRALNKEMNEIFKKNEKDIMPEKPNLPSIEDVEEMTGEDY